MMIVSTVLYTYTSPELLIDAVKLQMTAFTEDVTQPLREKLGVLGKLLATDMSRGYYNLVAVYLVVAWFHCHPKLVPNGPMPDDIARDLKFLMDNNKSALATNLNRYFKHKVNETKTILSILENHTDSYEKFITDNRELLIKSFHFHSMTSFLVPPPIFRTALVADKVTNRYGLNSHTFVFCLDRKYPLSLNQVAILESCRALPNNSQQKHIEILEKKRAELVVRVDDLFAADPYSSEILKVHQEIFRIDSTLIIHSLRLVEADLKKQYESKERSMALTQSLSLKHIQLLHYIILMRAVSPLNGGEITDSKEKIEQCPNSMVIPQGESFLKNLSTWLLRAEFAKQALMPSALEPMAAAAAEPLSGSKRPAEDELTNDNTAVPHLEDSAEDFLQMFEANIPILEQLLPAQEDTVNPDTYSYRP